MGYRSSVRPSATPCTSSNVKVACAPSNSGLEKPSNERNIEPCMGTTTSPLPSPEAVTCVTAQRSMPAWELASPFASRRICTLCPTLAANGPVGGVFGVRNAGVSLAAGASAAGSVPSCARTGVMHVKTIAAVPIAAPTALSPLILLLRSQWWSRCRGSCRRGSCRRGSCRRGSCPWWLSP